ncbi:MAG: DUF4332 domain-containing protein [Candidatus Helarchaeota archaeon]|nr:DUF4332 domain-containing protein [Candidatus Helarchaeota archaeon]
MSEDKAISELIKIKGLNKKQALRLYKAGINSIKKLGSSNPDEISKLTGIAKKQMTTWIILARAQERKKFVEVDTAAAELSQLIEIKIEDAKRLVSSGVMSVDDLAEESSDLLSEDTGLSTETIKKWIQKAKEVKKIPLEKRKVVVAPQMEGAYGSRLSGALFGSKSGFNSVYNSSSFGASFFLVLFSALIFFFYLSTSRATIGGYSLTELWDLTQIKYEFVIPWVNYEFGPMTIAFYPMVFFGGIILVLFVWLLFGKIVSSAKKLEFKNTSAVLGFAMAPGFLVSFVILGKFLPAEILSESMRSMVLPGLLAIFTLWLVIVFIRGLAFTPTPGAAMGKVEKEAVAAPKAEAPKTTLEVVEEKPRGAPTAKPAVQPVAERKAGPLALADFNMIDPASLSALQRAGYNSAMDLLRASSKDISDSTGIQQSKIIIWRIISDLLRIPGISLEHSLVLAKSGVRSVKHLAKINENALKVQVLDTISKENIPTTITAQMLADWIKKSQTL